MNKLYTSVLTLLGLLCCVAGCNNPLQSASSVPQEVWVNVLDEQFFNDCHISLDHVDRKKAVSVHVPFDQLVSYAQQHWDKEQTTIIVMCANYKCSASAAGADMLLKAGFKKVFAYEGGVAEARKEGIPVTGPCKEAYLEDYEKPAHEAAVSVPVVTVQDLKRKLEEFERNK